MFINYTLNKVYQPLLTACSVGAQWCTISKNDKPLLESASKDNFLCEKRVVLNECNNGRK